jgi:hypothetical protein
MLHELECEIHEKYQQAVNAKRWARPRSPEDYRLAGKITGLLKALDAVKRTQRW